MGDQVLEGAGDILSASEQKAHYRLKEDYSAEINSIQKELRSIPKRVARISYKSLRQDGFDHTEAKIFLKTIDRLFLKQIERQDAIDMLTLIGGSVESATDIVDDALATPE